MKLEIREKSSSTSWEIEPEGGVIGRDGGPAEVVVKDPSVSKRHAKVYAVDGKWFVKDLASSNGTFFNNERLTGPVQVAPGQSFRVASHVFEVVRVVGSAEPTDASVEPASAEDETRAMGSSPRLEPNKPAAKKETSAQKKSPPKEEAPPPDEDVEPPPPEEKDESAESAPTPFVPDEPPPEKSDKSGKGKAAAERSRSGARKPAGKNAAAAAGGALAELKEKGVGYFMIAVPKAAAYYLAAVPMMALNPLGHVRKGIAEPRFPAMGPLELVSYALPGGLFAALVGFVCTLIVQAVKGTITIGSILPVGPLVGAVVGALIAGFLWHPVTTWIVNKLKGSSDDVGRSNMLVMVYTAVALTAVPTGLATLFALIPYPIVSIIPALLSLASSLISTWVVYSWFKHFNVVKWFQQLLLGLGALAVLGTGYTVAGAMVATVKSVFSGSGSSSGTEAAAKEEPKSVEAEKKEEAAEEKKEAKAEEAKEAAEEK
ncbi:MAG: FHA domain-containing protein, partial [Myxococcota bacterium]